jgi:hypothetical protein
MQERAVIDTAGSGRSFVDNPKINHVVGEQQEIPVICWLTSRGAAARAPSRQFAPKSSSRSLTSPISSPKTISTKV